MKLYLPLRQSATLQEDIVPVSIPARKNRILAFLVLSNLCLVATLAVTIFAYFQKAKTEEIPLDFGILSRLSCLALTRCLHSNSKDRHFTNEMESFRLVDRVQLKE